MGVSVRPVRADQAVEFLTTMGTTYGFDLPSPARVESFASNFEWDRSRAAFDGDEMVGTSGAFSLDLTVPGGTVPCGGTTVVSVLPSHRRQGILRRMMNSHLEEVRDRGEPIAALWASDSAIYGRFGYGFSTQGVDLTISRDHVTFHRLSPRPAPARLITAERARDVLPDFYDRIRATTPGLLGRSQTWWEWRHFRDEEKDRDGSTAYRYATTGPSDGITGFVQYRHKESWADGHAQGEIKVNQLFGSDPESWAGLWKFVLDHDLITQVTASHRSVEDPLFDLLSARRRARLEPSDALWVRVMDPKAALESRAYSDTARVVVGLHDPHSTENSTWRLDLSPEDAEVAATDEAPSVTMDLEDLGACFLGWARFQALCRTGRVDGLQSDIAALDRAFSWSPLPWCPEVF